MSETTAYGVMDLTGYHVTSGTEKSGKYHFAAVPPLDNMRTFYFFAESEGERARCVLHVSLMSVISSKCFYRWMAAIKKSRSVSK